MPVPILRQQVWRSKTKWFAAAAAIAVAGSAFTLYRPMVDKAAIGSGGQPAIVQTTLQRGQQFRSEYQRIEQTAQVRRDDRQHDEADRSSPHLAASAQ
jgi:hypothetical protein